MQSNEVGKRGDTETDKEQLTLKRVRENEAKALGLKSPVDDGINNQLLNSRSSFFIR